MPSNPFWKYSLALYANTQPWCLQLQDRYDANVNLLLFCCFSGSSGYVLSAQQLTDLQQVISGWDSDVVKPLREIRRSLAASRLGRDVVEAKQLVLAAELEAEQQVQQRLYEWWLDQEGSEQHPCEKAIAMNLNHYFSLLGIDEGLPGDLINLALSASE